MFEIYNNENIEINIHSPFIVEGYINFIFKIKLYNFYGEHSFCISIHNLKKIIEQLSTLYNQMTGDIKLSDYDSESFICLKIEDNKMISINGQLGSEWEDNLWVFRHEVDQTIIQSLITNFNNMILI